MSNKQNYETHLASSYNGRDTLGLTSTITNAVDQRKVNFIYEDVENTMSEKTTVYLTKRPGVTINASTYGSSAQAAYVVNSPIANGDLWVASTLGNDVRMSNQATTTTIFSSGVGYAPEFIDRTTLNGTYNVVLQSRVPGA